VKPSRLRFERAFPKRDHQPLWRRPRIPSRLFQHGWEHVLEGQVYRVFTGDYNAEAEFLMCLNKAEPRLNVESKRRKVPTPPVNSSDVRHATNPPKTKWRCWTLRTRRSSKRCFSSPKRRRDGEALDRTVFSVKVRFSAYGGNTLETLEPRSSMMLSPCALLIRGTKQFCYV